MKKRITAFILVLALIGCTTALADSLIKTIEVTYGIKLTINGSTPTLTDVNGKEVQPFVYDGTTYVPIRAIADNFGADVYFDKYTNTAALDVAGYSDKDLNALIADALYYCNEYNNLCLSLQISHDYLSSAIASYVSDNEEDLIPQYLKNADMFITGVESQIISLEKKVTPINEDLLAAGYQDLSYVNDSITELSAEYRAIYISAKNYNSLSQAEQSALVIDMKSVLADTYNLQELIISPYSKSLFSAIKQ